jgi:GDP-4-dehydro-6-deoxy-D-mannose reductase
MPERMRPSDVELLLCDPTKFRDCTGWTPTIPLDQTLRDTLEYWRERVS